MTDGAETAATPERIALWSGQRAPSKAAITVHQPQHVIRRDVLGRHTLLEGHFMEKLPKLPLLAWMVPQGLRVTANADIPVLSEAGRHTGRRWHLEKHDVEAVHLAFVDADVDLRVQMDGKPVLQFLIANLRRARRERCAEDIVPFVLDTPDDKVNRDLFRLRNWPPSTGKCRSFARRSIRAASACFSLMTAVAGARRHFGMSREFDSGTRATRMMARQWWSCDGPGELEAPGPNKSRKIGRVFMDEAP